VVQGSGIGPLMFLLYISELIDILESHGINVKVFADDVKLYLKIISDFNFVQFRAALDSLYSWANLWQLPISVDKCYAFNIGTVVFHASLSINNSILPIASSVRDLGITVTNNLSPSVHISDIVSRAHKRALAIHRCLVSCDVNILLHAYKVYVRPRVEHNCIIWAPSTLSDIDSLESVQRRFTKRLSGLHSFSYEARLKRLKLQSLELRRLLTDLMWCYEIIFGLVDVDVNQFFTLSSVPQTRGHRYKVFKPHSTGIRCTFFCERVVNVWNNLPNFSSINTFKRSINSVDFSRFLLRNFNGHFVLVVFMVYCFNTFVSVLGQL